MKTPQALKLHGMSAVHGPAALRSQALLSAGHARGGRFPSACAATALPMAPPQRVLLTNDDGPDSPFFQAFVPHLRAATGWKCTVAIPASPESFVSKAIAKGPIQVENAGPETYHIRGPPATCVNLALHHLVPDCDFVISGPNIGHNAGRSAVLSSGTLGAAMEGCIAGRRSIAISFPFFRGFNNWTDDELANAVKVAGLISQHLWGTWTRQLCVDAYNVNIPLSIGSQPLPPDKRLVWRTHVDEGASYTSLYRQSSEDDHQYVWGPANLKVFEMPSPAPDGDVAAIKEGAASITPLFARFAAQLDAAPRGDELKSCLDLASLDAGMRSILISTQTD